MNLQLNFPNLKLGQELDIIGHGSTEDLTAPGESSPVSCRRYLHTCMNDMREDQYEYWYFHTTEEQPPLPRAMIGRIRAGGNSYYSAGVGFLPGVVYMWQ